MVCVIDNGGVFGVWDWEFWVLDGRDGVRFEGRDSAFVPLYEQQHQLWLARDLNGCARRER